MKNFAIYLVLLFLFVPDIYSDEGLWRPELDSVLFAELQSQGLKLSQQDIYSEDSPSLKDAVVLFGGGCTGVVISADGLILTNHHCGFKHIQNHSSVENNYVENGFYAKRRNEELFNDDLTVRFLKKTINVTSEMLDSVSGHLTEQELREVIGKRRKEVIAHYTTIFPEYTVDIRSLYNGNEYILYLYEEFTDIRLVYAPPISIGKFGGESDNWIWPRYTGDFALFRVYGDKDNKPAAYSEDNIPYKPVKVISISMDGVRENDFSMVVGYPGRTHNLITSAYLSLVSEIEYPFQKEILDAQIEIYNQYFQEDESAKIKYGSIVRSKNNLKKKIEGVIEGCKSVEAVSKRKEEEANIQKQLELKNKCPEGYMMLLNELEANSHLMRQYDSIYPFYTLGISNIQALQHVERYENFKKSMHQDGLDAFLDKQKRYFENYSRELDKRIFNVMMKFYYHKVSAEYHIPSLKAIKANDMDAWTDSIFTYTVFTSYDALEKALISESKLIDEDPMIKLSEELSVMLDEKVWPYFPYISFAMDSLYRTYTSVILDLHKVGGLQRNYWPNANGGMRLSYGKVAGYDFKGTQYPYLTTANEMLEKYSDNKSGDYNIPEQLKKWYKEYHSKRVIPACFITNCHTSSGNSGSPVFNGKGELIGLNFDRNWEGTMSDFMYNETLCRNISVDINYILFILKEYANAENILTEIIN